MVASAVGGYRFDSHPPRFFFCLEASPTRGSQHQHGHRGSDPLAEMANKFQHICGDSWKCQHAHDHEQNVQNIKEQCQQETLQTSLYAELVSPIPSSNIAAEALQFSYVAAVQHLAN
jgi:hypothetical protein